ncbi:MAG: hypothetical protein J07HX5_01208 [halophilic archaeon J07HX5]|nr:MAG: hypothetical protein J07HX5_01208 [halophilic archaeon J07HX5]
MLGLSSTVKIINTSVVSFVSRVNSFAFVSEYCDDRPVYRKRGQLVELLQCVPTG